MKKQIEEMVKHCPCYIGEKCCIDNESPERCDMVCQFGTYAEALYNAGYRKQNDEELIDKIATYFEEDDNWTKLKYSWNACGKSVQLRDMLRDAICGAKMKGDSDIELWTFTVGDDNGLTKSFTKTVKKGGE